MTTPNSAQAPVKIHAMPMTAVQLLKEDAAFTFSEFMKALDGVTEKQSWSVLPPAGEEYLHTDGSIHAIVLHVAANKWMYGSIAFRNTEIRWRDVADQIEAFEPSLESAVDYLVRGQEYWLSCWSGLTDSQLEDMVPTNFTTDWPAWKMIQLMNQHDSYHAGQVAVLRYASLESEVKPPSCAEDVRKYCADSKHW